MKDSEKRICIAWGGMPAYAACAVRQFVLDSKMPVRIISTVSDVPKTCEDELGGVKIDWVKDEDSRSIVDVLGGVPDVLFVSGWFIPSFNRFADEVRARGGRVIAAVDNRDPGAMRGLLWSIYFMLKIRRRFNGFIVPGKSAERLLLRGCAGRAHVKTGLYTADPDVFTAGGLITSRERKIIYVGRYDERKNIIPFIRVFCEFHQVHPEWKLECYGQGPLLDEMKIECDGLRIFPFLHSVELAARYREARVFVLPSVEDHWGVVVHEAALSGCALLLSNKIGAAEDLLGRRNGMAFDPFDMRSMRRALEAMVDWTDERWQEASRQSIEMAGRISPRNFSRNLQELVMDVRK